MIFCEYPKTLQGLIQDIKRNNCCFLVGAGISMLRPCKLPSGSELKNLTVTTLFSKKELEPYHLRLKTLSKYEEVVPEIIFQRIFESVKNKLLPFFNILKVANPNRAHKTLACLSDTNNLRIFTTNFDTFIDYFLKNKEQIIHLHGSLNDLSQMIIRIKQVGRGIEASLRRLLISLTKEKTLYVLGYLGNDKDIIDAINGCNFKKIIWFVRNRGNKKVLKNISQIDKIHSCYVAEIELNELFKDLSSYFKVNYSENGYPENLEDFNEARNKILETWSQEISMAERFACLEKIFFELEGYDLSANVCIHAISNNYVERFITSFSEKAHYIA